MRAVDDFEAIRKRVEELRCNAPSTAPEIPDWLKVGRNYYCDVPAYFEYQWRGQTERVRAGANQPRFVVDEECFNLVHDWITEGKVVKVRQRIC